jgi:hypothetical protein
MLLSAVSVLVIVLQSLEIPEGLMNNPVYFSIILVNIACIYFWPMKTATKHLYNQMSNRLCAL